MKTSGPLEDSPRKQRRAATGPCVECEASWSVMWRQVRPAPVRLWGNGVEGLARLGEPGGDSGFNPKGRGYTSIARPGGIGETEGGE